MTVSTVHPDYAKAIPDWEFMDYALGGERCVKEQGEKLLPKSQGMIMAEEVDPKINASMKLSNNAQNILNGYVIPKEQ